MFSRSGNLECTGDSDYVAAKTLEVYLDGGFLFLDVFTPATTVKSNLAWVTHSFTFTASGSAMELKFGRLNTGRCGPLLDAVNVTGPAASVDTDGDGVDDDDDAFINSNDDPTVAIEGCDSRVENVQVGGGAN